MGDKSGIEWTDATWNVIYGCSRVSPGCENCLDPDTQVLMADMTVRQLKEIRTGDEVLSFTEQGARKYERGVVEAVWKTRASAFKVSFDDGESFVASEDHHFLASYGRWLPVTVSP